MSHFKCQHCLFCLIITMFSPVSVSAMPAITCHCFTERTFNPSRPAAADPYFLAATQNTFFALAFNVEKKTIVMKKQKESSSDDLWVAYWVASKSGLSPEKLLQSKQSKGSWKAAIGSLGIASSSLGAGFSHELSANSPDSRLAEAVVNDLLTRFRLLSDLELSAMRKTGASNQELIIAALIAGKTRQLAGQVYAEAKKGTSWGVLLQRARIDTTQLQKELSSLPGLHGSNSR